MIEALYFASAIFLLYVVYTIFGMTLLPASLRDADKRPFSFLLAPLLGAAVWLAVSPAWLFPNSPFYLPVLLIAAVAWCVLRRKVLFLPREKAPYAVFAAIFFAGVLISRIIYPFEIDGGLYFNCAIYDHVRCAIVNSIADFGIPPANPWLADSGRPQALYYYFGWFAWAAQLPTLAGVSGLFAECCMTGFSALVVLSGLTGVAGLCGLGAKKYAIAALLFSTLLMPSSLNFAKKLLPENIFNALNPSGFVGFWGNFDNFVWSPHHMFSGAVVVLIVFFYFLMLKAKERGERLTIAVLIGILASSAAFASVYAGAFALVYAAISAAILYAANSGFRGGVNKNIIAHALMMAVFLALSFFYIRYLLSFKSETFPVAFGMIPAYENFGGWLRYLFSFYCFVLPNNIGACFVLGAAACLAPGLLPKSGVMQFFRIFAAVSFLSVAFIHSSFYSNDFGWRSIAAASLILSLFTAFVLVKFVDWLRAGAGARKIFGCSVLALLAALEASFFADAQRYLGIRKSYPELRPQFARSAKGWDIVNSHTKKTDIVQCNPKSFCELGKLIEGLDYSTNVFFALYSKRAAAVGDLIFAKSYSEFYPMAKLKARYARICRIFEGGPSERDIAYLADELKIKAILITPYDGIWNNPGAIAQYYPRLIETPDYKVYLSDSAK